MSDSVAQLYDAAIKDAARAAVGSGRLSEPDREVTIDNPLCGDRVTMGVTFREGFVHSLGHKVRGCLLCEAAASTLGKLAPGSDVAQIRSAADLVAEMLEGNGSAESFVRGWYELSMFEPVKAFKSRHRCVTLPFEALLKALDDEELPKGSS